MLMITVGLGRNWLQRSQATLARIHREEGNDSSSGGSGQAGKYSHVNRYFEAEHDADKYKGSPPADPRRQGPLYVEARGYLQPAVDFYARAVRAADALGSTTGYLLSSVCLNPIQKAKLTTLGRRIANELG